MKLLVLGALACSAVPAQEAPKLQVERVATGFKFTEGPAWSHEGFLLFSDIPANRIMKYQPGKGAAVWREPSNRANGSAYDAQGRLYICESGARRIVRLDRKGAVEVLADRYQGKRFNEPNDIVVRRDGHVYFTDPAWGAAAEQRELDFYGVYHLSPRRELELVARPAGRPNGLALSPNGKVLYVDNSDEKNVRAYDLDRSGRATNERVLVSGIEGVPDGMKVDEAGNLYVAARAVEVYSPEGKHLDTIGMPETPANCAWGDADLQSLYVTARTSLYRVRLLAKGSLQY